MCPFLGLKTGTHTLDRGLGRERQWRWKYCLDYPLPCLVSPAWPRLLCPFAACPKISYTKLGICFCAKKRFHFVNDSFCKVKLPAFPLPALYITPCMPSLFPSFVIVQVFVPKQILFLVSYYDTAPPSCSRPP